MVTPNTTVIVAAAHDHEPFRLDCDFSPLLHLPGLLNVSRQWISD
jgi:hypothetical protein